MKHWKYEDVDVQMEDETVLFSAGILENTRSDQLTGKHI